MIYGKETDTAGELPWVSVDGEDLVTIGGPLTPPFKLRVYIGGTLLQPETGCRCAACELLRSLPPERPLAG
jgi:hypothetical protein